MTKKTLLSIGLILAMAACKNGASNPLDVPANTPDAQAQKPDADTEDDAAAAKPVAGDDYGKKSEPAPGSREVQLAGEPAPTVFFLAGLKGYTEPCGCTLDVLVGGIDRIGGFLEEAQKQAKGSLLVDAGNTLFDMPELETHRIPQERAKAQVIVDTHVALGTASTTPGPNDFALGKHFYLDTVRGAGMQVLVANMTEEGGTELGVPHELHDLEGTKIGVVGLADPDLFVGIEGIEVSDPVAAAKSSVKELRNKGAVSVVVVYQGDLKASKELLEKVDGIDFVIVGYKPRERDEVDAVAGGYTLEAYDQGRYLGVLRLYPDDEKPKTPFANARTSSNSELERVERRIEQLESQIARIPKAEPGNEPPFLLSLREQLNEAKVNKQRVKAGTVEMPESGNAFVYLAVPMEPGYPIDEELKAKKNEFNAKLEELNKKNPEPIPQVPDGQSEYVGVEQCAKCHVAATDFWKKTAHSRAIPTLVKRNKVFDNNCVGCHVTGYRKPGGSVMAKLKYTTTVGSSTFTKNLENVGCEVCHGPGSRHTTAPIGSDGKPQHINLEAPEKVCVTCHNDEHSPRFDYTRYVLRITGEGHKLSDKPGK